MDGVILFVDDHIFEHESSEEKLFSCLHRKSPHPVLPLNSLEKFDSALKSISTFRAVLLDWEFIRDVGVEEEEEKALNIPTDNPKDILINSHLYSLIFIYSRIGIGESHKDELVKKYGEKIRFMPKPDYHDDAEYDTEADRILGEIKNFQDSNPHLTAPYLWSKTINKSVQSIFHELEDADKNWISDLYHTAEQDGVEPSIEVINLFQNLLAERVIQFEDLRKLIKESASSGGVVTESEAYAKLFRTFLYGKATPSDPIMTGDIFELGSGVYSILVTPECDISKLEKQPDKSEFELLTVVVENKASETYALVSEAKDGVKKAFSKDLETILTDKEIRERYIKDTNKSINDSFKRVEQDVKKRIFNQPHQRLYFLPCFPFIGTDLHKVGQIDFRDGLKLMLVNQVHDLITTSKRTGKLNSPYIQDLRQRYLAYKGRVGVPSFPEKLRDWVLSS